MDFIRVALEAKAITFHLFLLLFFYKNLSEFYFEHKPLQSYSKIIGGASPTISLSQISEKVIHTLLNTCHALL